MKSNHIARELQMNPLSEVLSIDQLDLSKLYSYADYFRWKFEERVELIKGFIYKMCPAPSPVHQSVAFRIGLEMGYFFKAKPCRVFHAPFDVRLPDSEKQTADELIYTVVQPDLCVICDLDKIDKRGCIGSPDLVVEILSPGNTKREMGIKFRLYEESGVKEYWMVDPLEKVIYIYVLDKGKYVGLKPIIEEDIVTSVLFSGLKFKAAEIFDGLLTGHRGDTVKEPEVPYASDILSFEQLNLSKRYTYADYFRWDFEQRIELFKGFVHLMEPSGGPDHQSLALKIMLKIGQQTDARHYRIFPGPFDVRLAASPYPTEDRLVHTVVQPDLSVISNPKIIDERGCAGAPDLIVEVLSPESRATDTKVKYAIYQEYGVKEYWLADPTEKSIHIYILQNGKYIISPPLGEHDHIKSALFPALKCGLQELFSE